MINLDEKVTKEMNKYLDEITIEEIFSVLDVIEFIWAIPLLFLQSWGTIFYLIFRIAM